MNKNYQYFLLFIILFVAACLRFHHLGEISFSNDELSALTRARYDSFHELVEKGIKVDGHPALVQTMTWFIIHHFGDDVFTVRFPFAVAGIISVFLVFLLGRRWFGPATGLLSAAALASLQFPLLYSQTARPYSIGLMFSLALAYLWTRLVFDDRKNKWIAIAYILASAGCIYSHYFSFLLAGIIGVSGLFFLRKDNYIFYLICNMIPLLLFIPSVSIFHQQFGYEGVGGWLPPPERNFITRYIFYGFNDSWFITIFFSLAVITAVYFYFSKSGWKKFHLLSLAWYFLPFIIGYSYSILKAPVLQYSTLLFSFPFILIFIFSFFNKGWMNEKLIFTITLVVLAAGTGSTVIEKKYYHTNHFGVFMELAEKSKNWDEQFGKENIVKLFSLSNPEYINYYFRRLDHQPGISIYTDDEHTQFGKLIALLDTTQAEYFVYAWTNAIHTYETLMLIREKFPVVAERDTFFNSEITLFKRGPALDSEKIISETGFEKDSWDHEIDLQNKEVAHSGMYSQKLDGNTEFSVGYKNESTSLQVSKSELIKAEGWFYCSDSVRDAALVISFLKNGETISYSSAALKNFFIAKDKWTKVFLTTPIPGEKCEMFIYIWNPKRETFYIDDLSVKSVLQSPLYRP